MKRLTNLFRVKYSLNLKIFFSNISLKGSQAKKLKGKNLSKICGDKKEQIRKCKHRN